MKADLSRNTFQPLKHFSRVLMQQGRVQLDADFNEQVAILLHHLRMVTLDSFGPFGAPAVAAGGGFEIRPPSTDGSDFLIGPGRCYVEGLLVENHPDGKTPYSYASQPYWFPDDASIPRQGMVIVYLDVWERLVTAHEDPSLREVALGGPDTAARAQIVWQVKVAAPSDAAPLPAPAPGPQHAREPAGGEGKTKEGKAHASRQVTKRATPEELEAKKAWEALALRLRRPDRGTLKAWVKASEEKSGPCLIPPSARYRGENQLWRVEVHRGGIPGSATPPTFKVSRDNGAVLFPVLDVEKGEAVGTPTAPRVQFQVTVASLGRDARTALAERDWVELVDMRYELESADDDRAPDSLLQVTKIDADELLVTLEGRRSDVALRPAQELLQPALRRWDQATVVSEAMLVDDERAFGTFAIVAGRDVTLEPGIHFTFEHDPKVAPAGFRRGDYWLIPGREATGDIEWPTDDQDAPLAQEPLGVTHYYAPLAAFTAGNPPTITQILHASADDDT